jgi:hypothetical protein
MKAASLGYQRDKKGGGKIALSKVASSKIENMVTMINHQKKRVKKMRIHP